MNGTPAPNGTGVAREVSNTSTFAPSAPSREISEDSFLGAIQARSWIKMINLSHGLTKEQVFRKLGTVFIHSK